MDITFLVGNGFDIAAGLNTGYTNFYTWYCNQPSPNEDVQSLKDNINEYIQRVHNGADSNSETWADFELGLGAYTAKFTTDNGNAFLQCREDAFNNMIQYLESEQNKFDVSSLSDHNFARIKTQLGNFYSELQPNEQQEIKQIFNQTNNENAMIKFISFNYTTVLDQVIQKITKDPIKKWTYGSSTITYRIDPVILHIHGSLDEYPILAVSDETQIHNQDLLSITGFRESMIKSAGIQAVGRNWYKSATNAINNSRIICVFGMSLGASDKVWWEKLAAWLNGSSSRRLIIFHHLKNPIGRRSVTQYVISKNEVVDKLLSYSPLSEASKEQLKSRIYVAFNASQILQLREKVPALV